MDRAEAAEQWFAIAAQDLDTAEHVANTMRPTPHEIICFHCQQSAEKYLKGFLVLQNIEPEKTHNLIELCKMCEKYNAEFSEFEIKCGVLTQYGILPRYPNELQITVDDMKTAIQYAKDIKEFVASLCGTDKNGEN
jgi:HEPN domain-containing protein